MAREGFSERDDKMLNDFLGKLQSNPTTLREFRDFSVPENFLEVYRKGTGEISGPQTEAEALERLAIIWIFNVRCYQLGDGLCYDQTKWDDGLQCRTCCTEANACVSHPNVNQYWKDIEECLKIALAAAGLSAIVSGGAAAIASFKAAFYACITSKLGDWAGSIQVTIKLQEKCGNWHWCGKIDEK